MQYLFDLSGLNWDYVLETIVTSVTYTFSLSVVMSTISQHSVTVMQFLSKLAFNKKYSLGFCKEHKSSV